MQLSKFLFVLVGKLCLTLCDPVTCQAPPSMGFPRQEYWSGLPSPPPGDCPNPGIEPESPALVGRLLTTEPRGSPYCSSVWIFAGQNRFMCIGELNRKSRNTAMNTRVLPHKDACSFLKRHCP